MQVTVPGSNKISTVEALVSGHPWGTKKVSVTGAGRLREYESIEFVGGCNKTGF